MRISDWSSDVCSSDLVAGDGARALASGELAEDALDDQRLGRRSEEHTSELQSLMRISYAVFCLKKKKTKTKTINTTEHSKYTKNIENNDKTIEEKYKHNKTEHHRYKTQ